MRRSVQHHPEHDKGRCPRQESNLRRDPRVANTVRFSPDGSQFVTAGFDGRMIVWEATTGAQVWSRPAQAASELEERPGHMPDPSFCTLHVAIGGALRAPLVGRGADLEETSVSITA